ncbi:plasma membrane proteolipid Pmp31 [Schizosaccharomyces cryophilus OY26]|uniref:Plasma membrane proteolipid Pmp31 n=1 Tax=Schizosaccharomyces cryophilus (strain OY26 / ATCC MYA-4695 / CBS 11777 / NBRC 106824 / NRRL Y48691) TaxID=653667 RepID=S9VV18_SCHCR|nr:plasma membrane proteolipid Pmp31 [Schizosaccharomyces cryophilus OY26]EPY49900.1 plasma membrane proteolipid Pmp31 [Schizosaccharomyces cryophilus OY26]
MSPHTLTSFLLIVLSIFVPFIVVGIRRGFCSADFLINICLCALGLPGIIHAIYIVLKYPSYPVYDTERGQYASIPPPSPTSHQNFGPNSATHPPAYSTFPPNGTP